MKKILAFISVLFVVFFILITGCNNVLNNIHYQETELIDTHIMPMSHCEQEDERGIFEMKPPPAGCSGYGFNQIMSFINISYLTSFSPSIWPGYLINPRNLVHGDYTPINAARNSLTLVISDATGTYKIPGIPATGQSVNSAISGYSGTRKIGTDTAPSVYTKIENVYSPEQLRVIMGAHLPTRSEKNDCAPEEQFDFGAGDKIRILFSVLYVYFDVSIVDPEKPHEMFGDSVTWSELEGQLAERIAPAYIYNVEYGKMALFFIEASVNGKVSTDSLHSALLNLANGTIKAADEGILNDPSVTKNALMCKDDDAKPYPIANYDDLCNKIDETTNTDGSLLSTCVPVRYTLKYLNDTGAKLDLALSGTFCSPVSNLDYSLTVKYIKSTGREGGDTVTVKNGDKISISTVQTYTDTNTGKNMFFSCWHIDYGNCTITNDKLITTMLSYFTSDCSVTAVYNEQGATPTPTVKPTAEPTAAPTDVPPPPETPTPPDETPDPPTPVPMYTVTVTHMIEYDNSGHTTCKTVTDNPLSVPEGGSVTISTAGSVLCYGGPDGYATLNFKYWSMSGSAIIESSTSSYTKVSDVKSNVTVTATYQ